MVLSKRCVTENESKMMCHGLIVMDVLRIFSEAKIIEVNGKHVACDHCAGGGKVVERWLNETRQLACHFCGRRVEIGKRA